MRPAAMTFPQVVALFVLTVLLGGMGSQCARAHDPYSEWKTRNGVSCCHDKDCAPATAWRDAEGRVFVRQNSTTYFVPEDAILPIPSPDGRSHACVIGNTVICAVMGEPRS